MMKARYCLLIATALCISLLAACSDSSSGPNKPGTTKSNVSGTLKGPDGTTPIPGATVYVAEGGVSNVAARISSGANVVSTTDCPEPTVKYTAYTCTNADGTFSFEIPIEGGKVTLSFTKGAFAFSKTIDVTGGSAKLGEVTIPSGSELDTKIAVVTGSFDRMQDILAKFGLGEIETNPGSDNYGKLKLGTEKFDLYNGDNSLDSSYPEYEELFSDADGDGKADINNYDIVFVNCGAGEDPVATYAANTAAAHKKRHALAKTGRGMTLMSEKEKKQLRAYVENGGILYATDLTYDYVEQTFPEFIDFNGSNGTSPSDPEENDAAEVGKSGITVDADILQSDLNSWLQAVSCNDGESCLNDDDTIHLESFLGGWVVMEGAHSGADTKFWIKGDIKWFGANVNDEGVRPLTASFKAGKGQVVYSSYHTVEDDYSPYWRPQERVLQYLVLE